MENTNGNSTFAVIKPAASSNFVETPFVKGLIERAMAYLKAGFPVHLLGPTGSGKTTLALHISEMIGRPAMLIYGDDEFGTSDLIGNDNGYSRRRTVDNYIHSVLKVEESVNHNWVDNRLTVACREGYTLIYDEFTRSRPEANNALLSVLAERVLVLPAGQGRKGYIKVHPEFRAVFTSNPIEYVGTHQTQNALLDRMITIHIPSLDQDTEAAIAAAHSGLDMADASQVIKTIHLVRDGGIVSGPPSVRAAIMICRILAVGGHQPKADDHVFVQTCIDVLNLQTIEQQYQFMDLLRGSSDA
ncbi:MAG: gas vesicle protein GvpN [Chloroflexi bacterium]|nr:gas vesicle protein GvpN [Chloroflexota bacterium]